jgi:hypothetical protein
VSVTATILEDWQLVENDTQLRSQKRREVDVENRIVMGWLEQADVSSLTIKRHFIGLLSFTTSVGDESASFTYHVGAGVYLIFTRVGGEKYLCTRDKPHIEDHIDGEGWETQVWERVAKWEMVEGSYYEEDLPEEGDAFDPIPPEE